MLRNALYVGRLVWNRATTAKDPSTGRRRKRSNPESSAVVAEVPGLRIVPDGLWERVQARLTDQAASFPEERNGLAGPQARFWERRGPRHLLSGKVFCGACGGPFSGVSGGILACRAADAGACANRRSVRRDRLEARVLEALGTRLMRPGLAEAFAAEFAAEWERLRTQALAGAGRRERDLAAVERRIGNLVDAIADGQAPGALVRRLSALEAERDAIVRDALPLPAVPSLPKDLGAVYRTRVAALREALREPDNLEALSAARDLVERVTIHPASEGGEPAFSLAGDLGGVLALVDGRGSASAGPDGTRRQAATGEPPRVRYLLDELLLPSLAKAGLLTFHPSGAVSVSCPPSIARSSGRHSRQSVPAGSSR